VVRSGDWKYLVALPLFSSRATTTL
jgi:hypothetical protein